jgi:cephalosporin-C deacetylase-like acetyl esterase
MSEAELLRYRVATSEPDGLDEWWAEHLSRARSLAKPVALEQYRSDTYGALEVFDLDFPAPRGIGSGGGTCARRGRGGFRS